MALEKFKIGTLGHQDSCVMRYSGTSFRLESSYPNDTADQRQSWAQVRDFKTLEQGDPKCGAPSGVRPRVGFCLYGYKDSTKC